jgi:hypothetical protein
MPMPTRDPMLLPEISPYIIVGYGSLARSLVSTSTPCRNVLRGHNHDTERGLQAGTRTKKQRGKQAVCGKSAMNWVDTKIH